MSERKREHYLTSGLFNRVKISGTIEFLTAFHLGTGKEGESMTDLGVLVDIDGTPLIPGSSLKGAFRSTAERIAHLINLESCFLNPAGSCPGGNQEAGKKANERLEKAKSDEDIDEILSELCDTCLLFGSTLARGKVYFRDALCEDWAQIIEVRDGVAIDRDSGTAAHRAKYDFEIIPRGATFQFELYAENLSPEEELLLKLTALEWSREVRLGGKTSSGLGLGKMNSLKYKRVDLTDPAQCVDYLCSGEMKEEYNQEQLSENVRKELESRFK